MSDILIDVQHACAITTGNFGCAPLSADNTCVGSIAVCVEETPPLCFASCQHTVCVRGMLFCFDEVSNSDLEGSCKMAR